MQTNFAEDRLADPDFRSSEKILRTCVHCGFCTATCPTYLLLGDELDSPRGRIYLIKDMLESGKPATKEIVTHVDRCLSCLSCMTTCPSGVHYMHLVDHARAYINDTYRRPLADRLLRRLLAAVLPYPNRFRLALLAAMAGKPLKPLVKALPVVGQRLAAMLELAPGRLPSRSHMEGPQTFPPEPQSLASDLVDDTASEAAGQAGAQAPGGAVPVGRVALLSGCAQTVLQPAINEAAIRLLTRHGIEVVLPRGEGCCGALVHHMGDAEASHAFARANIDAWTAEIEGRGLDAILITASGCGTTVKDYGFMFRDDAAYAEKAARVSGLARDVTEYVSALELVQARPTGDVVTYHSACSLQHGQQIREEPKRLLKAMGFAVKDVPEGHICCGSAGVYNILQPEIATSLQQRKISNIAKTKPQIIAAGNIGCMTQIGQGLRKASDGTPVVHTIELLDWATGGPLPETLADHGFGDRPALER